MDRVAIGVGPQQTLSACREAEAYDGPSLLTTYGQRIGQASEMRDGLDPQSKAVVSGHWGLSRYDSLVRAGNGNAFLRDSPGPRIRLGDYREGELRLRALADSDPAEAERLRDLARRMVRQRWQICEDTATGTAGDFPANARKDH